MRKDVHRPLYVFVVFEAHGEPTLAGHSLGDDWALEAP